MLSNLCYIELGYNYAIDVHYYNRLINKIFSAGTRLVEDFFYLQKILKLIKKELLRCDRGSFYPVVRCLQKV
jgi:hypothetical protein